jgi:hypothetical protein
MKAIKSSTPIKLEDQVEFKQFIHANLIRGFQIKDYCYIGSFGKKLESNDVDVAVIGDFENVVEILNTLELEFKIHSGFNIISIGVPFKDQIIQVDLMFTDNLEWSKFIYYSPNLMDGESKYKGLYRNMLLSDLAVIETRKQINDFKFEQLSIVPHKGLVRTEKTLLTDKGGILKNPKIIKQTFLTNEPSEVLEILNLSNYCMTFESLYAQVNARSTKGEIEAKFKESCNRLNLQIPNEILHT